MLRASEILSSPALPSERGAGKGLRDENWMMANVIRILNPDSRPRGSR